MTVQRQYILPNCNLTVEGLLAGEETDPNSPLTVVLNSECTFPGTTDKLSGGREFLNALVESVSNYAQSLLSGIPYPLTDAPSEGQPVTLKPGHNQRHQLVAQIADTEGTATHRTVELNSVQLFDLMEAVDQLLADSLTLPDMTLQLTPLDRRHARPAVPATKRAIPAAVGVSTLAASAALLFMFPIPEFEPSTRDREDTTSEQIDNASPEASTNGEATSLPAGDEPAADTETETNNESPAAETDDGGGSDSADAVDPVTAGIALGRLSSAPTITDTNLISDLEETLEADLQSALEDDVTFEDSLTYRVAVSEDGDILGYKYENDAALANINNTPLPDLTFIPIEAEARATEPVAQFLVTFDEEGTVTAEPAIGDAE